MPCTFNLDLRVKLCLNQATSSHKASASPQGSDDCSSQRYFLGDGASLRELGYQTKCERAMRFFTSGNDGCL